MIEFTEWAIEILSRADQAARRFNPDARLRVLHDATAGVKFELTDEPHQADTVIERYGFTLFVERGLDGTVDVIEPHDRLILRAPGDPERSVRGEHGTPG